MYDFDFEKLLRWLLPFEIRKPKMLAFYRGLLSFIENLYQQFLDFIFVTDDRIRITGQVRVMRYELNKLFDPDLKRIEILDAVGDGILFVFVEAENNPVYLPTFINGSDYDFLVRVPIEYQAKENFIKEFLNRYKLASKRYHIEYF